jgi:predicted nuclease of restriction endonuclease-like RecB superfamily
MTDLIDTGDLPWIGKLVDVLETGAGLPWRVVCQELDRAPIAPRLLDAVTSALRRQLDARSRHVALARRARGLVFGTPALDANDRAARIANAANALDMATADVEAALWSDIPSERPVILPKGRPVELEVAAAANVQLIQRALRRAQHVRMRLWGDNGSVLRSALARGLLVTAARGRGGETVLDVVGPLALFHRTSVYARVLAQLVPLLAACEQFELELDCETGTAAYSTSIASPVLLPPAPRDKHGPSRMIAQLARDLAWLDPKLELVVAPPPITAGAWLACPDLVIDRRWHFELVGFWTAAFIERKLSCYAMAGISDVWLCIDERYGAADDSDASRSAIAPAATTAEPSDISAIVARMLRYKRRLTTEAVLAAIRSG